MQPLEYFQKFDHSSFFLKKFLNVLAIALLMQSCIALANNVNNFYAQLSVEELHLAESVLQKSIDSEPENLKLQQDLAYIQYYLGDFDTALTSFQSLESKEELQENTSLFYGLALVHHELEQAPASLKNIVKAYNLDPENYEIVKLYADISHHMNLHKSPIEEHNKSENVSVAIPETEEDGQFNFKSALNDYKNNNIAAAKKQLETLLADNPDDIDAMVLLAFIFYREGNSLEAERIFSELASRENFDENSDVLYGLALSQRNLGKNVEAFENILRAIVAETTREDLKALYRSLAVVLSTESDTNTQTDVPKTVASEEDTSSLTLSDVIADVTESEDFDSNQ